MVVGAVGMEIIKFLLKKPASVYKNVTINLALPLWVFNDPLEPIVNTDKEFDPIMCAPIKVIPDSNLNNYHRIHKMAKNWHQGPNDHSSLKRPLLKHLQNWSFHDHLRILNSLYLLRSWFKEETSLTCRKRHRGSDQKRIPEMEEIYSYRSKWKHSWWYWLSFTGH